MFQRRPGRVPGTYPECLSRVCTPDAYPDDVVESGPGGAKPEWRSQSSKPGVADPAPQVANSLRCVCTDMRIPNAAISVTMEVPPKLISGNGSPTTGSSPETMPMLTNT